MSQENVEIVRRAIEAAIRRPKPDFATINALFHPDHEFIPRREALEGGSVGGVRGYRDWLQNAGEILEWESRLEEVTEIDDDRVLAITPTRFRGKASGVILDEQQIGCIVTVQDGKVTRTEAFPSRDEALEAAGLSE